MRLTLLDKLYCPDCRLPERLILHVEKEKADHILEGDLKCPSCGAIFTIQEGIPILLPSTFQKSTSHDDIPLEAAQKRGQIAHFNSIGPTELEINRPHGCGRVYNFLLSTKFEIVFKLFGDLLVGQSVLDVCCGSGMDAEYLVRSGADVVGIDISYGALMGAQERSRRYGLKYDLVVGDVEALPIQDVAFDLAFVHDGLHHLDSPQLGFLEMARIASHAVLLTEPARALATAIAVKMGVSEAVEESGNRVYRFSEQEFRQLCVQAGLKRPKMTRYVMFYRQEPFRIFQLFENTLSFAGFIAFYRIANLILGRFGNKIAMVAER